MGRSEDEQQLTDLAVARNDSQRFLKAARIAEIGGRIAPMIGDGSSWIERRKESVRLLDDTALRRQITVDFSLRRTVEPLLEEQVEGRDSLFCAPVFVLPKSPASFRSFDLLDEDDHSLFLIGREDNARISAEALIALVKERSELEPKAALPPELERELRRLAQWEAGKAEQIAERLISPGGPWPTELAGIRVDDHVCGWLKTLSHSSIVAVLFRSAGPRRKLMKLSFEEDINTKQRRLTRLGWAPYEVMIDSPRIEARSFHFEAEAPAGLRISEAQLTDSEREDPIAQKGSVKRVHLYREAAERAGAGTTVLSLDVAGPGFVSGAMLASSLTIAALFACAIRASAIAANPTSAPALLLVLPGLIASYVARPDRHALTTRLLSFARVLLLGVALCAYIAAARVALGGAHAMTGPTVHPAGGSLGTWLWILMGIAVLLSAALALGWIRGAGILRRPDGEYRYACMKTVEMDSMLLKNAMTRPGADCPHPANYSHSRVLRDGALELSRSAWHGDWTLILDIQSMARASLVVATLDYVKLVPAIRSSNACEVEAGRLREYLSTLSRWAGQQQRDPGRSG